MASIPPRVPVGSRPSPSPSTPSTARSHDGFSAASGSPSPASSPWYPKTAFSTSRDTAGRLSPAVWREPVRETLGETEAENENTPHGSYATVDLGEISRPTTTISATTTAYDPGIPDDGGESDDDDLAKKYAQVPTTCYSREDVHMPMGSWLSVVILSLSVYSTVTSCLWLFAAIYQPRWGHNISTTSGLTPANASLLATLVAKTIEASFITVFVAFVGQMLTRRAFIRKSAGMTVAEMTMRNWVIQPGSILTYFETVPYAGRTLLGALSLLASIVAAFYTTASDAMVSPKLMFGSWEHRVLQGRVRTSYANPLFVQANCPTPLRQMDPNSSGAGCLDVQYSGNSYKNLLAFMATWSAISTNGTLPLATLDARPPGTASLFDNTTMTGSWVATDSSDIAAAFATHGRIINNVTMAMPHPGVYAAATDPVNGILQPADLEGVGEYNVRASVVSPAVNVLCVNLSPTEAAPLVYATWPNRRRPAGTARWQAVPDDWNVEVPGQFLNRTVVDDIFRWGPKYGRVPPAFPIYPIDYNIVTNVSDSYTVDAVYVLAKSASMANYTLCELRSWTCPTCSTSFWVSGTTGGHMQSNCDDPADDDRYDRTYPDAPTDPSHDWKNLANEWRLAIDLNGGLTKNNASNARILTSLALLEPRLPGGLPSMAEGLAVLASSTLVAGSLQTTFRHYWQEGPGGGALIAPPPGLLEPFNATVRTQEFTSTHLNRWQGIFYAVLGPVFLINLCCLAYYLMRRGLVTDFTEPQNLFALALNSPPSRQLAGACGAGPGGRDLVVPWRVAYAPSANHYFFDEASQSPWRGRYRKTVITATGQPNPVVSSAAASLLTMSCDDDRPGSKNRTSYQRLSSSKSWL